MQKDGQRKVSLFKEHITDHACICSIHAANPLCIIVRVNWHLYDREFRLLPYVGTWSEFCPKFRSCWHLHLEWLYISYGPLCENVLNTLYSFIWQSVTFAAESEGLCICVVVWMALYPSAFTKLYIFGFNTNQDFISISGNDKMTKFSTWLVTTVELGDEAIELRK